MFSKGYAICLCARFLTDRSKKKRFTPLRFFLNPGGDLLGWGQGSVNARRKAKAPVPREPRPTGKLDPTIQGRTMARSNARRSRVGRSHAAHVRAVNAQHGARSRLFDARAPRSLFPSNVERVAWLAERLPASQRGILDRVGHKGTRGPRIRFTLHDIRREEIVSPYGYSTWTWQDANVWRPVGRKSTVHTVAEPAAVHVETPASVETLASIGDARDFKRRMEREKLIETMRKDAWTLERL